MNSTELKYGERRAFPAGTVMVVGTMGHLHVVGDGNGGFQAYGNDAVIIAPNTELHRQQVGLVDRAWLRFWDDNGRMILPSVNRWAGGA